MSKKQIDRPMHRIAMTAGKLRMWNQHGDAIFTDPSEKDELLKDAAYAVRILMDFRNIINGMVGFEEEPKDAAAPYLDDPAGGSNE